MKTAHYTRYGGAEVFTIVEKPKPEPKLNEILVKVVCTTVNRTDTGMTSAAYFVSRFITGLFVPKKKTPGTDFSGIIEAVGSEVTRFKVGDEVFGFDDNILSSQAEYFTIAAEGKVVPKPREVTHMQAAASCEGPHYVINMFRNVELKPGSKVLVYGATGSIGTAAVQLGAYYDVDVDAVANTANLSLVSDLGADKVFNYEEEDFTKTERKYDFIVDAVGKSSFKKCKPLLTTNGIYVSSELGKRGINIWLSLSSRRVIFPIPKDIKGSLEIMRKLLRNGTYRPVITKKYPLSEIQDAYRFVSSGQKTGNVMLEISRPK